MKQKVETCDRCGVALDAIATGIMVVRDPDSKQTQTVCLACAGKLGAAQHLAQAKIIESGQGQPDETD